MKMQAWVINSRVVVVALLVTVVAGCGWHLQLLQKVSELPPVMSKTAVVSDDAYGPLTLGLKTAIKRTNVRLLPTPAGATAVVRILSVNKSKRVVSVDSQNRAQAYQLRYSAKFSVTQSSGTLLVPQSVAVTREYDFDPNAPLAANDEATRLFRSMSSDLVTKIMRQLAAINAGQRESEKSDSAVDDKGEDKTHSAHPSKPDDNALDNKDDTAPARSL